MLLAAQLPSILGIDSCQILVIVLSSGIFVGKLIKRKLRKFPQERALRFIYQDQHSSYGILLSRSRLSALRVRRLRAISLEVFKILNNQTPVYLSDLLTYKSHSHKYS